jgi:hypothetical protein
VLDEFLVPDELGRQRYHFGAQARWGRVIERLEQRAGAIEARQEQYAGHVW